jgi:hypothetical protein
MGGVAWMGTDGKAEVYTSVGGFKQAVVQAPADRLNLFTRGMTACFTVIIASGRKSISLSPFFSLFFPFLFLPLSSCP